MRFESCIKMRAALVRVTAPSGVLKAACNGAEAIEGFTQNFVPWRLSTLLTGGGYTSNGCICANRLASVYRRIRASGVSVRPLAMARRESAF
jgi:hypothetical protein